MDATRAFTFARGALWHTEVARPQVAASALEAAPNRDALVLAAAGHLRSAAADLGSASEAAGRTVGDATLATDLLAAASRAEQAPHDAFPTLTAAIDDARRRTHAGVQALVPHLDSPAELLHRAPASQAPADELAHVTTVEGARGFRQTSDLQRAERQHILDHGDIDPEPVGWVGGYGNGNGAMPIVRITHPDTPHLEMRAVHRPATAQAAQEEFMVQMASKLGIDQYYTPIGRRADGSGLAAMASGRATWDTGVDSGDDLADVMAGWYRTRMSGLSNDQAQLAGRIDRELATVPHYVTAQPDLNAGGMLIDRDAGSVFYIDNGFAGRGESGNVLQPAMKSHFLGGTPGHADLLPETTQLVAARMTDDALTEAHAVLKKPGGDLPSGHAGALAQDASDTFLEAMRQRRDHVTTHGAFDYVPMDLNANPLAFAEWVRNGRP